MLICKSEPGQLQKIPAPEKGCWISLTAPTEEEITSIAQTCALPDDVLRAALDPEERSYIDTDEGYVMIVINVPTMDTDRERELYDTIPLSIIMTPEMILTVCREDTPVLRPFAEGKIREFSTVMKTRFVFQILYAAASLYLMYLRQIDRRSEVIEAGMHRSTRNREIFELLKLQKSLVYFTSSLRQNESVLEKLMRTDAVKKYPEDAQILEDAITENKQALEMAGIYRGVLSSTTDAIASVISNNQNTVMKTLSIITIVMAIPTILFSAYGMNVASSSMPLAAHPHAFFLIVGISLAFSGVIALLFSLLRRR